MLDSIFSLSSWVYLFGLQVSDWNQARLDRQEAAYHLQFLYEEISDDIDLAA